jgi:hypothetical protein
MPLITYRRANPCNRATSKTYRRQEGKGNPDEGNYIPILTGWKKYQRVAVCKNKKRIIVEEIA